MALYAARHLQQACLHRQCVSSPRMNILKAPDSKQIRRIFFRFPGLGIASVAFVCYVIYDNMTSKESLEKAKHEADQRSLLSSGGGLLKEISKEVTQSKSH